jgi:hypothetical protein
MELSASNLLGSYNQEMSTASYHVRNDVWRTRVTIGIAVIIYLVILFCVAMLFIWQYFRIERRGRAKSQEARFALEEGQTILGVVKTRGRMYFWIGEDVLDEKNYE